MQYVLVFWCLIADKQKVTDKDKDKKRCKEENAKGGG